VRTHNSPKIFGMNKRFRGRLTSQSLGGFTVGIHENIAVTSAYNTDGQEIPRENDARGRMKPAYNALRDGTTHVSHIYTAAHNINPHQRAGVNVNTPEHRAIAHAILM